MSKINKIISACLAPMAKAEAKAEAKAFHFSLQLFAAKKVKGTHIASKAYVKSLKSPKGVAMAYNLKVLPDGKHDYRFVLNREYAQVTALNEHYLASDIEMFNLIGQKFTVKRGFVGYATMDLGALVASHSEDHKEQAVTLPLTEIIIGEYKGHPVAGVHMEGSDYIVVKSEEAKRNGDKVTIPYSEVVDIDGHTREGWMRFKDYKNYGSSKGRKNLFDMFEQDSNFEEIINTATYGEYSKVKGMPLTAKETAEAVTRLGAKSCGMGGENILVENIAIHIAKSAKTDGAGWISNLKGVRVGYVIQGRVYTEKGACLVITSGSMRDLLSNYSIVVWDKYNLTRKQKELLDALLNKCDRRLSGMSEEDIRKEVGADVIILQGNPAKGVQIFGDLNLWKDKWDYSRTSGLNIVDVARFTGDNFSDAATSGQMLKLLLGCSATKEIKGKISKFLRGIISAEIANKFSGKDGKPFGGDELISTEYAAGVAKEFNPTAWRSMPSLYQLILGEQVKSLKDMFNRDRYHVPGHSAMATVDIAYAITGGRNHLLAIDVVDGQIRSFEVFDPVANRYIENTGAGRRGFVVKYPSMGTKEGCVVTFVSDEEMQRRIRTLGLTKGAEENLATEVACFREGGVMCPADLDILQMVLAGYDLDGDHLEIFFSSAAGDGMSIPELLIEAGFVCSAINIQTPGEKASAEVPFSARRWAEYSALLIEAENKNVGTVTNTFRLFTDGLLQDLTNPDVLRFYELLLEAIGATHGKNDYESVIQTVAVSGVNTYLVTEDAMEVLITKALKGINLSKPENVHAILEDMDKLGRACQELTIDAQKKFFSVFSSWMDETRDFSLFCLTYGVNFTVDFNKDNGEIATNFADSPAYVFDEASGFFRAASTVVRVQRENRKDKYILADAFTRYRVFAINHVDRRLKAAKEEYTACLNAWKANQAMRTSKLVMIKDYMNTVGLAQIEHVLKALGTVNSVRRSAEEKLKKLHDGSFMPKNLQDKLDSDIRKAANADYAAMLDDISNEIRRIAAEHGIDMAMVAEYFELKGLDFGMKVIKQERFVHMLKHSELNVFHAPLRAPQALKESLVRNNEKTVQVAGGMFYNVDVPELWGVDIYTDLADGTYTVTVEDGTVYVSRPLDEFVDVSGINVNVDSRLVIGALVYEKGTERTEIQKGLKELKKGIAIGKEVSILRDTRNKKFALLDVDGKEITRLKFGTKGDKTLGYETSTVVSSGYGDFAGKVANNVISGRGALSGNSLYYNFIVVIKK